MSRVFIYSLTIFILPTAKLKRGEMLVKEEKAMAVSEESGDPRGTIPLLKPHFVLVHGIGGGAWCWYKIRCLMENSGYKVSCIDLKSAGIDHSHADSLLSFHDYNQPLMDFLSALPEKEQVLILIVINHCN